MKSMIEEVAELLNLGYSAHEITRIFHIPVSVAEDIIQQAEQLNDTVFQPYTDEIVDEMAAYYGEDSHVVHPYGEPDPGSWD